MQPYLFIFLAIAFLQFACKPSQKAVSNKGGEAKADFMLSEKERIERDFLFFDGLREKMLGNQQQAAARFNSALRLDPRNATLHYELAMLNYQLGKLPEALNHINIATKQDSKNKWFWLLNAAILEAQREFAKAAEVYERIIALEPRNMEFKLSKADALIQAMEHEKAIHLLDAVEKELGKTESVSLAKKDIFLRINKVEKAGNELQALSDAFPTNIQYKHLLGEFFLTNNKFDKALAVYEAIAKIDSADAQLFFSLAELYRSKGDQERSFYYLKKAFANPQANIDDKVKVLLSYYNLSEFNENLKRQALELCQILVIAHKGEAKAHAVFGDFLYRDEAFAEAKTQYTEVLKSDKSRFAVWNQLLMITAQTGDHLSMLDLSSEAIELFPYQSILFLYQGSAAFQLKKYEVAIEALQQGISVTIANNVLSAQLHALLGDTYYAQKKLDLAWEAYDKALKLEPDNFTVLNNYAYYLSEENINLDKAKSMAARVIQQFPDNASYLDTYAWVLYRMGDFQKANEYIDRALDNGGMKRAAIVEHKGDILYRLGRAKDALDYWKRAADLASPGGALLRKIELQKLENQ